MTMLLRERNNVAETLLYYSENNGAGKLFDISM